MAELQRMRKIASELGQHDFFLQIPIELAIAFALN